MTSWHIKEGDSLEASQASFLNSWLNHTPTSALLSAFNIPDRKTPTLTAPGPGTRQWGLAVPMPQILKIFKLANRECAYPAWPSPSPRNHSKVSCPQLPALPSLHDPPSASPEGHLRGCVLSWELWVKQTQKTLSDFFSLEPHLPSSYSPRVTWWKQIRTSGSA